MKLPYLGIHNPILSHFSNRISGNGNGRSAPTSSSSSAVTSSRFHFSKAVPHRLKGNQWHLQRIQQANAALAYEAYLAHPTALTKPYPGRYLTQPYTWQNHIQQIETYVQEHEMHKGFAYIVLNKANTKCLGMVQVVPLRPFLYYNNAPVHLIIRAGDNAAMITYWLVPDTPASSDPCQFIQALQGWFARAWEFDDYYFRINPNDTHCLSTLADSGLEVRFNLRVHLDEYAFYSN